MLEKFYCDSECINTLNDYNDNESCISASQFREFEFNELNPRSTVKSVYVEDVLDDYEKISFDQNKLLLEDDFYKKYVLKGTYGDSRYMTYSSSVANHLSKINSVPGYNNVFDNLYGSFSFGKILISAFLKKSIQLPFFGKRKIKQLYTKYPLSKYLLENRILLSRYFYIANNFGLFDNNVLDLTNNLKLNEIISSSVCTNKEKEKYVPGYSEWYNTIYWYRLNNRILRKYNFINFIDVDLHRSMFLEKRFLVNPSINYIGWLLNFFNVKFSTSSNLGLKKNMSSFNRSIEHDISSILNILKEEKSMKNLFLTFCKNRKNFHVYFFYKKLKLVLAFLTLKKVSYEKELKDLYDDNNTIANTSKYERYKGVKFNKNDFIEFKDLLLRKSEFFEEKLEESTDNGIDSGIDNEINSDIDWYYLSADFVRGSGSLESLFDINIKASELKNIVNINDLDWSNSDEFIINNYCKSCSELEEMYCDFLKESDANINSQLEEEDLFFYFWK